MSEENNLVISMIRRLAEEEVWGHLTLKLQHGKIVHIVKEESLRPADMLGARLKPQPTEVPEFNRRKDGNDTKYNS